MSHVVYRSFEYMYSLQYAVDIERLRTVSRAKKVQPAAKLHDTVNQIIGKDTLLFINAFNMIWQGVDYILFLIFDKLSR